MYFVQGVQSDVDQEVTIAIREINKLIVWPEPGTRVDVKGVVNLVVKDTISNTPKDV